MPPERKPEKTLVRLKPGEKKRTRGVVVDLTRIQGGKAWIEIIHDEDAKPTIDKFSTKD